MQRQVFNTINREYGFNKSEIAKRSGLDRVTISRFLNGQQDIGSSSFFQLINSMPKEFQEKYWRELLGYKTLEMGDRLNWEDLISKADYEDFQKILKATSERWLELTDNSKLVKA